LNLRTLIHNDQLRNTGKTGWARYAVLSSFFLLLAALALANSVTGYLAALLLLPFAIGVLKRDWRSHIWLCFVLLFYFMFNVNQLAAAPGVLAYVQGFLIVTLFTAAMFYCRWSKAAPSA